jgi:prepilin signal peptidase PulO-like enzyme (type II secretory pathway)
VLGWLRLRDRCRACRAPISPRYQLVELAMGVLWFLVTCRLLAAVAVGAFFLALAPISPGHGPGRRQAGPDPGACPGLAVVGAVAVGGLRRLYARALLGT